METATPQAAEAGGERDDKGFDVRSIQTDGISDAKVDPESEPSSDEVAPAGVEVYGDMKPEIGPLSQDYNPEKRDGSFRANDVADRCFADLGVEPRFL